MSNGRYHRQEVLIGQAGQQQLKEASILLIGVGGIGSPLALYLAAAGIGHLGMIDEDIVEISNLQRQILFNEADLGLSKVKQATLKLQQLNSDIEIACYDQSFTAESAHELLPQYDLIIDGSDNFPTRYCVNDFCRLYEKPLISASVHQRQGQVVFFDGQNGCYRCLFPQAPLISLNCATAGVLGMSVGMTATTAGMMAINFLLDAKSAPKYQLLLINTQPIGTISFPFQPNLCCHICHPQDNLSKQLDKRYCQMEINPSEQALKDYHCIDIREQHEERSRRLTPEDTHIPLSKLASQLDNLGTKPLLFYCAKGIRSRQTAFIMRDKGFDAFSFKGGLSN